jgi:hypothetical protein
MKPVTVSFGLGPLRKGVAHPAVGFIYFADLLFALAFTYILFFK